MAREREVAWSHLLSSSDASREKGSVEKRAKPSLQMKASSGLNESTPT